MKSLTAKPELVDRLAQLANAEKDRKQVKNQIIITIIITNSYIAHFTITGSMRFT